MFELALELGMTVHQLLTQMDSMELTRWRAFFRVRNAEIAAQREHAKSKTRH